MLQLNNLATTTLDPIAVSPACMFRRVRLIANGSAVVEDIDNYGRTYQVMSELLPCQRRMNDVGETWGGGNAALSFADPGLDDPIPGDSSRQVCVQLMSSFLSQGKMTPLHMLPLTVELELDDASVAFAGTANW